MTKSPSVLVIGREGALGSALLRRLAALRRPAWSTSRRHGPIQLDLTADPALWPDLPKADVWVFCAAVTGLDACERNPEMARRVNALSFAAMTRFAHRAGAFPILLSSNMVFDGTRPLLPADARRNPQTVYGHTKVEAEDAVLESGGAVLRLSKVLTPGKGVLTNWMEALKLGKPVQACHDMVLSPISVETTMDAIMAVADRRLEGISQLCADRDMTYLDAARHIAARLGRSADLVTGIGRDAAGVPEAFAPRHTTLVTDRLNDAGIAAFEPEDVIDSALSLTKAAVA